MNTANKPSKPGFCQIRMRAVHSLKSFTIPDEFSIADPPINCNKKIHPHQSEDAIWVSQTTCTEILGLFVCRWYFIMNVFPILDIIPSCDASTHALTNDRESITETWQATQFFFFWIASAVPSLPSARQKVLFEEQGLLHILQKTRWPIQVVMQMIQEQSFSPTDNLQ